MSNLRATIAAIAAACTLGSEVSAQQNEPLADLKPPSRGAGAALYRDGLNFIRKHDKSGDGELSRQEIAEVISSPNSSEQEAHLASLFFATAFDAQRATRSENLSTSDLLRITRAFQSIDPIGFPSIYKDLLTLHEGFKRYDLDGDREISKDELKGRTELSNFVSEAFPEIARLDSQESGISMRDLVSHMRGIVHCRSSAYTASQFLAIVNACDTNKDGLISREEAKREGENFESIRCIIARLFDEFSSKSGINKGLISAMDLYKRKTDIKDLKEIALIEFRYRKFEALSSSTGRESNSPRVTQGFIGNCYLIAALNAVIHSDPESLSKIARRLDDGNFKVTFPGAPDKSWICTKPTLAERGVFCNSTDPNHLPEIIEKGYGLFIKAGGTSSKYPILPQEYAGMGGSPYHALGMLTGVRPLVYKCSRFHRTAIRELLERSCPEGKAITPICLTTKEPWLGFNLITPKFTPGHAWSIHGYSKENGGVVTIRNPTQKVTSNDLTISLDTLISEFHSIFFVPPKI